jgi:hypothetical protein
LDIPLSKVYLTLGNVEQLYYTLQKPIRCKYHPTTLELAKEIETPVLFEDPDVLIWPLSQTGSGLIKTKASSTPKGAIPSDQFVKVAKGKRVFIMFCGVDGIVSKSDVTAAKKLAGGCFEILDLRGQSFKTHQPELDSVLSNYPLTAKHAAAQLTKLQAPLQYLVGELYPKVEHSLIQDLATPEGLVRWGSFNSTEIYKYFLLPNYKLPPILATARAWGLEPYLTPFVTLVKQDLTVASPGAHLANFAAWVYYATNYWATANATGLSYYEPPKGLGYFRFTPSLTAKRYWHAIIKGDLTCPKQSTTSGNTVSTPLLPLEKCLT